MFHNVSSTTVREHFRAYLDHVMATGNRVLIYRHGKEVGALVCREDFNALEAVSGQRELQMAVRHKEAVERFRLMREKMR